MIKGIWSFFIKTKTTRESLIEEGRTQEREAQTLERRFEEGEERITALEEEESSLEGRVENIELLLEILIASDQQDIKAWIKQQHDKWMPKKYIEDYALDLLERRYAIYVQENGNSWAERLMTDLRSLPIVSKAQIDKD